MANADFSRQQNRPTGGFDASSYRAAAPAEEEVRLTPFQQKLASLEKALPAALSRQAVAVALCIVVMLACFFGFGGAKLRAKYDTVKNGFTTGVAADSGYALNEELTTRLNTAANIITTDTNGYKLIAAFDNAPDEVGKEINGIQILHSDELEAFCAEHHPEVAVLCLPRSGAEEISGRLVALGIQGFWNFSHYDLSVSYPDVVVENVHLGDSLMSLGYRLRNQD